MSRLRCEFEVVSTADGVLTIADTGHARGKMTVTNDVDAVVLHLVREGLLAQDGALHYYDSQGKLDGIRVRDGRFDGFYFLPDIANA